MDYVLNGSLAAIELTNIVLCYSQILHLQLTNKKSKIVIWYMGVILLNAISIWSKLALPISIINLLYGFATIWFIINDRRWKAVKLFICAYMIESIICLTFSYIYAIIKDIPQKFIERDTLSAVMINSSFWIIMTIKKLIAKYKGKKTQEYCFDNQMYVVLTVGSISFFLISSAIVSFANDFDIPYEQINLLGLLLTCVCIIFYLLFFWLGKSIHKNESYLREKDMMRIHMSEQEKYIKLVIEKDADMRRFKHDIKEHMWVVSTYLSRNEQKQAQDYIDRLYQQYNVSRVDKYTGVASVDAILSAKKKVMDDEGIEFIWQGSESSIPVELEMFDLCTLFTNVLNNAIEACRYLDNKDRRIEMQMRIDGKNMYVMERNKIVEEVRFDDAGNPITIKQDKKNHGYGCKNIRNVVEKYNGEVQYNVKNKIFEIEIII